MQLCVISFPYFTRGWFWTPIPNTHLSLLPSSPTCLILNLVKPFLQDDQGELEESLGDSQWDRGAILTVQSLDVDSNTDAFLYLPATKPDRQEVIWIAITHKLEKSLHAGLLAILGDQTLGSRYFEDEILILSSLIQGRRPLYRGWHCADT